MGEQYKHISFRNDETGQIPNQGVVLSEVEERERPGACGWNGFIISS